MTEAIRYVHEVLSSGEHHVWSPDVKGLCAISGTENGARREAVTLVALFRERGIPIRPRTNLDGAHPLGTRSVER